MMQYIKRVFFWLWSKKWRTLSSVLVLVLLGYRLYQKYLGPEEDTSFVSMDYEVMSGEISNSLNMVGTTQFANAQKLTFVNKGRVTSVKVKIGDTVQKGQVLATITTDDLDKEIERAKQTLKNHQLTLKKKLDSSNRELDLLEAESSYQMLLLKQKSLPEEQRLALRESERALKDKEKELKEAEDDYAALVSGKAGVTNPDLVLSKLVRTRNEKFEELVRGFRSKSFELQGHLNAYDKVFKLTDLYDAESKGDIYIGAKNQPLLAQSKNSFWEIKKYVDKLHALYEEYSKVAVGELTPDYILSGYRIFLDLGRDMQQRGKINYDVILESIDHIDLTKPQIVDLAKALGSTYEDYGFEYQKNYEKAVDILKDLKDSDTTIEDSAAKVEKIKIELEKQKLAHEVLKKQHLVDIAKQEKEVQDMKDRIEKLKSGNADQEDIDIMKNNITESQFSLDSLYKKYDEYKIIANFDGVVTKLNMQVGDSIGINSNGSESDQKYIYVETPDLLEVKLDVDQIDIVKISMGMPVQVFVDALPDAMFEGKFSEIDTMSEGSSYKAKVVFQKQSPDQKILGGMSANIKVVLEEQKDVLVVPNPALADNEEGQKIVRLKKGETWIDQVVEVGISDEMNTVILSGLKEGDLIKGLYINDITMENVGIGSEFQEPAFY